MKKFLLSLAALLCLSSVAMADVIKITPTDTEAGYGSSSKSYVTDYFEVPVGNYKFMMKQVYSASGQMKVNDTGNKAFNLYNTTPIANLQSVTVNADKNTLGTWYMSISDTAEISSVATTKDIKGEVSGNLVTFTVPEGTEASYFHINITTKGSGAVKFSSIDITYKGEDVPPTPTYAAPLFNPADGSEVTRGQEIKLSADEADEIYYRMVYPQGFEDYNTEEFTLYEGGMYEIMAPYMQSIKSFSVEAYAKYGENVSETVTANYTIGKADVNAHFYDFSTYETITEYTMNLGDEIGFSFEALYMDEFDVTSTNEDVAKYNWDYWGFEIVGAGKTTLTITIPESMSYKGGTASLDLIVVDPNAIWEPVTSIDQIKDGDTVTFMAKEYTGKASGAQVKYPEMIMSKYENDLITGIEFSYEDFKLPAGTMEFTLNITAEGKYTLYSADNKGYLNATTKNKVNLTEAAKELTISIAESGAATVGGVTISGTSYTLRYNANISNPVNLSTVRFAFYANNGQQDVYMYRKITAQPVPEGAHSFEAKEVVDGDDVNIKISGVHAESELYYRFTAKGEENKEPEVEAYAVDHEGFTKSENCTLEEDGTYTHLIPVTEPGTFEIYTYHAASDTQSEVKVLEAGATTGIDFIGADNDAEAEYFNLQGIRVENPENGLYIVRQGGKTFKVVK